MEIDCMIKELRAMAEEGIIDIEVYYAENMTENVTDKWSIDVMQNRISDACSLSWVWTILSTEEDKAYHEEYNDNGPPADYDIIVDAPFSDDVVCVAVQTWLYKHGLGDCGFNVVMIDLEEAAPYSGYVRNLMNRDLDAELETAEPLFID